MVTAIIGLFQACPREQHFDLQLGWDQDAKVLGLLNTFMRDLQRELSLKSGKG